MIVLISYDLKNPEKDYAPLYESIKNCGSDWWHYLESVWIIKTELSPQECFDRIRENITTGDRCLIVNITKQSRQGWLPANAWNWIKEKER